ncbi:MAG: hypothetical protein GXO80_01395 [Chlorobi bacterium]|nr:hypothetical protein [Chlorobiota bacterium]
MRSLLEIKIRENYSNAEDLILIIRKYDFEAFLNKVFHTVNEYLKNEENDKILNIANTVLTNTNEKLRQITSKTDKKAIKYLLSDIFKSYITEIDQKSQNEFIPKLIESFKTISNISDYNYAELENLLNLESSNVLKSKKYFESPYYEWAGKTYEFDEFLRDIKDKRIITSIKSFKKLFKKSESEYFVGNPDKIEDLLIVFVILKEKKLIRPKVISGYFSPLVHFGVDNEKNFLFKKAPNKLHELLKRNTLKYNKLKEKHEKWITYSANTK